MPSTKFSRAGEGDAIVIQGFAQLQAALRRVADGVQDELRQRVRAVGDRVALVAASNAPRGATGDLQQSIKASVTNTSASVYSSAVYGGAINVGAWTPEGRGPHISRANASHYMNRAVAQTAPWVEQEMNAVVDWVTTTFTEAD